MNPEAVKKARERYAREFHRRIVEQREREHAERMETVSPATLNAEREALIIALAATGKSIGDVANAVRATAETVRRVLGRQLPKKPVQLSLLPEGAGHV